MPVRLSRRTFLASGSLALGTWPLACAVSRPSPTGTVFRHGVASGDPAGDGVVLWSRVTTMADGGVDVSWVVAADAGLRRIVARGTVPTGRARDHTVKVEVSGLEAGKTYYYAFDALGDRSPIGRTRTLPARGTGHVRLAVASCANLPAGYFTAYRHIAARDDLDAVLHLGDYIYEYENGRFGDGTWIGRLPVPAHEAVTLDDYRARHAQYKADPDLQAVHRQHPFIAVWDDHDFANDAWQGGAENHDDTEGAWEDRRRAAMQAYFEWMPVREGRTAPSRLCRTFRFGALAELVMLDTRMAGRDRQAPARDAIAAIEAPGRRLISRAEEHWLAGQLASSREAGIGWQLIGQQVMFAPQTRAGQPTPALDSWDGYRAARDRVFDIFDHVRPPNLVMLTGDAHSSWAYDLARRPFDAYDPATGRGAVGVEIVGTSITSPTGLGAGEDGARQIAAILEGRPHLQYLEPRYRGYVVIDVTRERLQADWYVVPRVDRPGAGERFERGLVTEAGRPHLVAAGTPARPRGGAADPAPA